MYLKRGGIQTEIFPRSGLREAIKKSPKVGKGGGGGGRLDQRGRMSQHFLIVFFFKFQIFSTHERL